MYKVIKLSNLVIVKQDGNLIQYIKDPSEKVKLAANGRNTIHEYNIEFIGEYIKVGREMRTKAQWLRTTFKEIESEHSIEDARFLSVVKKEILKHV